MTNWFVNTWTPGATGSFSTVTVSVSASVRFGPRPAATDRRNARMLDPRRYSPRAGVSRLEANSPTGQLTPVLWSGQ